MSFRDWFKSRYTAHLEAENAWLRLQLEDAMKALSPRLEVVQQRREEKPEATAGQIVERKHFKITRQAPAVGSGQWFACSCGWQSSHGDEAQIMNEAQEHRKTHYPVHSPQPIQRKSNSWTQAKRRLENQEWDGEPA